MAGPESGLLRVAVVHISELMADSGVGFGTSGARGLASDMTDRVCYAYTLAFLKFLQDSNKPVRRKAVAIAGDFRPSTPRIMTAVAMAIRDAGFEPVNCGFIPTPAVALYGITHGLPAIMVTGSHIPDDRNGIKFYKPEGEILKPDEQAMTSRGVNLPEHAFDASGMAISPPAPPATHADAQQMYIQRYTDFFAPNCLTGRRIGVYEHSSVARDILGTVLTSLGAEVVHLGRSERFIPVDTEAIRAEDVTQAKAWTASAKAGGKPLDCIVSADGDGDRPLISDEFGTWLRGDIAGILCARFLKAESVTTPVSCNSAVEKSGWFRHVERCRIGSPYVIAAMQQMRAGGAQAIVGYEANGGFLTDSDIDIDGRKLTALPTRDAVIVPLAILQLTATSGTTVSGLLDSLPRRFTASDRLKNFPNDVSQAHLARLNSSDPMQDRKNAEAMLGDIFGKVVAVDTTDGIRISFASDEVVHLRASGNAPELRCYTEADSSKRAVEMNRQAMACLEDWRKHALNSTEPV